MTGVTPYEIWIWGHTQKGKRTYRRARKAAALALKRASRHLLMVRYKMRRRWYR